MTEVPAKAPARDLYDVIVIGGGPAGLTAAIYLARACYRVLVIEKEHFGGQITITDRVVNYPGIASISGAALTENMRQQVEAFGAEFKITEVTALDMSGDIKTLHTTQGILSCFGVLLAAGARPRSAGFTGEDDFRGRGVAYCATCDGEFFRGKQVFVVVGGYAAAEESVFLTKYASHVTCLVRGDDFSCAKATADEARNHPDITVRTHTVVESVEGDTLLRRLTCRNTETGETKTYDAGKDTFGVFVFAGYEPATELIRGIAELDPKGYVITDASMKTSCDGLYAAGDIRIKPLRQCITAAGDGALAATELERYALQMQKKTGIHPLRPAVAVPEESAAERASSQLFQPEIVRQLQTVFARMERGLELRLYLDDSAKSDELASYMDELARLTDKIQVVRVQAEEAAAEVDASDGGLDVLDLHADALERGEDAAHVGNQGDDTADGHAEERLHRTAAHGERHHEADDDCAAADDDGRVDGVTEIAALHGSKTALQSGTEVLCHVALLLAEMDGADVVDRLRDQGARLCDGCAIVELGLAHALLEVARQQEE